MVMGGLQALLQLVLAGLVWECSSSSPQPHTRPAAAPDVPLCCCRRTKPSLGKRGESWLSKPRTAESSGGVCCFGVFEGCRWTRLTVHVPVRQRLNAPGLGPASQFLTGSRQKRAGNLRNVLGNSLCFEPWTFCRGLPSACPHPPACSEVSLHVPSQAASAGHEETPTNYVECTRNCPRAGLAVAGPPRGPLHASLARTSPAFPQAYGRSSQKAVAKPTAYNIVLCQPHSMCPSINDGP